MATITLSVNGAEREVSAEPDMPLLWVLRDLLGLTGTKYGCGAGQCGACAVLLDGALARSCVTEAAAAAGRAVTTVEGLAEGGRLSPLQQAWLDEAVPQCGYCQSGQLIAAAALLARSPKPSDEEIDAAFADVLCRCGTYMRVRRAVHRAAGE